jgi:FMN phosphatase YigB (HAD superfamily)
MRRHLFLDLDGVLADFDRGVETLTDRRPDQLSTRAMWRAVSQAPDFFGSLAMMQDAHLLWAWCRPLRPTILTGLPFGDWAPAQKRRWVANMLGADVEVITCHSRDKHHWSGPGRVLVDDREAARAAWLAGGGDFVLHRSAVESIEALRQLGLHGDETAA